MSRISKYDVTDQLLDDVYGSVDLSQRAKPRVHLTAHVSGKGFASKRTALSSGEFLMKYVHAAFLAAALVSSGCAFAEDSGATASSGQPNVVYRVMTSPSASDVGTNSNYPLDPQNMVAIDNSSVVMPNNNGPVQSANSLPQPIDTTTQFAGHRTQPVVRSSATNASPNG